MVCYQILLAIREKEREEVGNTLAEFPENISLISILLYHPQKSDVIVDG